MTILILKLTPRHLQGSLFAADVAEPSHEFSLDREPLDGTAVAAPTLAPGLRDYLERSGWPEMDAIGLHVPFGGDRFRGPVMNSPAALQKLEQLVPQSPLHLPHVLALAEGLHAVFAGVPTVLMFETSFFTALPHREQAYGLDPEHMEQMALWRFGFHGILHEAACRDAVSRLGVPTAQRGVDLFGAASGVGRVCGSAASAGDRRQHPRGRPAGRAIVRGSRPERRALKLAHDLPGGLEEANQVLTRESGLLGLIGEPVSLAELLMSERSDWQLARDVFCHSVLRACGAAIAAICGVDMFVYSGRYAAAGGALHQWLAPRLARRPAPRFPLCCTPAPSRSTCTTSYASNCVRAIRFRTSDQSRSGTAGHSPILGLTHHRQWTAHVAEPATRSGMAPNLMFVSQAVVDECSAGDPTAAQTLGFFEGDSRIGDQHGNPKPGRGTDATCGVADKGRCRCGSHRDGCIESNRLFVDLEL